MEERTIYKMHINCVFVNFSFEKNITIEYTSTKVITDIDKNDLEFI